MTGMTSGSSCFLFLLRAIFGGMVVGKVGWRLRLRLKLKQRVAGDGCVSLRTDVSAKEPNFFWRLRKPPPQFVRKTSPPLLAQHFLCSFTKLGPLKAPGDDRMAKI